jgi:NADPH-dependent F420 reductase
VTFSVEEDNLNIGIVGGTGQEGQGLALRWASRGVEVLLGSRDPAKAERVAGKLNALWGHARIRGFENRQVACRADALVSTLPHKGHRETLQALRRELDGKLLLVATVIWPPGALERPSAAEEAQETLPDSTRVVAAFQTVSALSLSNLDETMGEDVLVFGRKDARREAIRLIGLAELRGIEAGPLAHARIIEAMTGVLININKNYGIKSAGLRITGLD